ncbi:MAG TPA: hypothetical protein VKV20_01915 [Ktedonobacteraceae bacterium]|jgi:hypothetical protein|nr:hypothetical protein [Ktedonobacteraceae bacterium]
MPSIGLNTDISALVDALAAGDTNYIIDTASRLVEQGADPGELIGRIGMIVAHGDSDGHPTIMLAAASMMCRWLIALQYTLGEEWRQTQKRAFPLLIQSTVAAIPQLRAGREKFAHPNYPDPLVPGELSEGQTVNSEMHKAIYGNDPLLVERLLLGLYSTGADYRTIQIRSYDGISTTFHNAGHPLMFAVRGTQLLDAVEWGDRVPNIVHWLAPHLPITAEEPAWVNTVRAFLSDEHHSLDSYRTRLAAPKNENALPLRKLVLSDVDAPQICSGVFDALIQKGASSRGIASVIALAATDLLTRVGDGDREAFIQAAHGLLFASAVRIAFTEIQDVEALPLLFTSACYINALHKEIGEQQQPQPPAQAGTRSAILAGGLIAPALLDTLREQLDAQDLNGAYATARRYIQLGHDVRSLFASMALASANTDPSVDQGHTLQIVQAACEEHMGWPASLSDTNIEGFLHVALRAIAFAKHNDLVKNL